MSHDDTLLRACALRVGFGRAAILPPIDLALRRGELWGLVGCNGAGKTTLLRTLLGLHAPVSGEVERAARLNDAIECANLAKNEGMSSHWLATDARCTSPQRGCWGEHPTS